MSTTDLVWIKSSYSGGGGDNCVEAAVRTDAVHVRDSKDTDRQSLAVGPAAWADFVSRL
ncbi:DUF397 domain-containing protein [Streptomyces sp. SP18CS02]|uniref:DUF397 domain-containing protein n=1 Tax=Streptomyces sp. SP18CS02 TaxID=3002531 RepID=UPI002E786BAF|nr:DUF397 domain-containing protein [Streptomyces sp. SP18CS02]MEE1752207.1 DUF397 domain-containing protein [Streptomyces sp. SP18CS02]